MKYSKKLIEVALPLDVIKTVSARSEKALTLGRKAVDSFVVL
jgi:hypothetical protein